MRYLTMRAVFITGGVLIGLLPPLLPLSMPGAEVSPDPVRLSVCDLFRDLRSYRGRVVAVRGILYSGSEIFALGERACPVRFVTGRVSWPTAIALESSEYVAEEGQPVPYRTDHKALKGVLDTLRALQAQGGDPNIRITVVGELRVQDRYVEVLSGDGVIRGNGFGHLGSFPALLVIKTVQDMTVENGARKKE